MRVVSWIVVIGSIGWLLAFNQGFNFSGSLPTVAVQQVAGTAVRPPAGIDVEQIHDFAQGYTTAWNSQDPARVLEYFTPDAVFIINDEAPYEGAAGISQMVSEFMSAYPDMEITMTGLQDIDGQAVYQWSFTGTDAQTGNPVSIAGTETWDINQDGLLEKSVERYDAADFARQVALND